jgi:hypothetical protein
LFRFLRRGLPVAMEGGGEFGSVFMSPWCGGDEGSGESGSVCMAAGGAGGGVGGG